jgi:putative flippase GtrA
MPRWLKRLVVDPGDTTLVQVPRALVASCLVSALDFGLMVLLVEKAGWDPDPAVVVSFLVAGVLQYILCATWVFAATPGNNALGFVAFTALNLIALGITWATVAVMRDRVGVHYTVAKLVAFATAFVWNFLSRKYLLFRTSSR